MGENTARREAAENELHQVSSWLEKVRDYVAENAAAKVACETELLQAQSWAQMQLAETERFNQAWQSKLRDYTLRWDKPKRIICTLLAALSACCCARFLQSWRLASLSSRHV